jgi:hypothetical protein
LQRTLATPRRKDKEQHHNRAIQRAFTFRLDSGKLADIPGGVYIFRKLNIPQDVLLYRRIMLESSMRNSNNVAAFVVKLSSYQPVMIKFRLPGVSDSRWNQVEGTLVRGIDGCLEI